MTPVMVIGGTDSSGGAGLTRDTCVAHDFGCRVLPIVTAVTAQSDDRVFKTQLMPADVIIGQIEAALATVQPDAIKIGMLGSAEIADAVSHAIRGQSCRIVIDPVLKSSSGRQLMSGTFPGSLLAQAHLVTPNLLEAAALSGLPLAQTDAQIVAQAEWFLSRGAQAVLIKGGHASGETCCDHLFQAAKQHVLRAPRLKSAVLRGTGCALATAIACGLARGDDLYLACRTAKSFVQDRLREVTRS
ncbi:MAG: hydroxymethylpyrimidine/phosphomethylpyrimidine kinase [Pseudomonadota bacterium]